MSKIKLRCSHFCNQLIEQNARLTKELEERQRVEEELQASKRLLSAIIETHPDVLYIYDLIEQRAFHYNRELYTSIGYTPEELIEIGAEILPKLMHPNDLAKFPDYLKQFDTAKEGEVFEFEYRMKHKNGEYRWFYSRDTLFARDKDGKPQQILGAATDITERKQVEEKLRKSEESFRALVENSPDIIGRFDHQLRHLYVNPAVELATGIPPEAFLGKTHRDLGMPEEIVTFFQDALQSVFTTGQERLIEFGFPSPNGIQYYQSRIVPEFNSDGTIGSVLKVARNITEPKQAEAALRESEQRFRSIFEQAAIGIAIALPDGRLSQVNQKFTDIIGYTSLEIQVLNFQDITHPDDLAVELEYIRQCLAGESSTYSMEKRYIRKDGSIVWVNLTSSRVFSGAGEPQYAIAVVEDISDRKLAEQKLRETTFLYQRILDAIPDLILCKGSESKIIYANKAFRDYYGMTMEQLQGIIDAPRVNPEYTQQYVKDDAYVFNTGQTLSIEEPVVRYDGIERLFSTVKSAIRDTNGQVVQTVGVSRDITEQKLAEESLRVSERRYSTLARISPVGIFRTDTKGQYLYVNERWCEIAGLTPSEALAESWSPAIHPADQEWIIAQWYQMATENQRSSHEYQVRRSDGVTTWVLGQVAAETEDSGEVTGFVGTVTDITKLKQTEQQLQQLNKELVKSNRELAQFADVVSQNLQQLLRNLNSFTQLLAQKFHGHCLDTEAYQYLDLIVNAATLGQQQIHDLLVYYRVGTSRREFEPTGCNSVLRLVLTNLQSALASSGAIVTYDSLPTVMADGVQLIQLFQNLINNALKFRRPEVPPKIHISVEHQDNEWLFGVHDNGIGIKRQDYKRIFQIFQLLHTEHKYSGTGAGLAICKKIVERHGGEIWVESRVGIGATFYFTIPEMQ